MMTQRSTGATKRNESGQMPKSVWSDGRNRTLIMFTDSQNPNHRKNNHVHHNPTTQGKRGILY